MPPNVTFLQFIRARRSTTSIRRASTQPPPPRPYKAAPSRAPKQALEQKPAAAPTATNSNIEKRAGALRYFWPFSKGIQKPNVSRALADPARGKQATDRVVETGELDPRYKDAAFRVTAIVAALPVVIYLGYVLFQRRFEGVEKRPLPRVKRQDELR